MNCLKRKRDALLMAPQTERGYVRTATGTDTLTLSACWPDPVRTFSVAGNADVAAVSYSVREHVLTDTDTRLTTARSTFRFLCSDAAAAASGYTQLALLTFKGYLLVPAAGAVTSSANSTVTVTEGSSVACVWSDADATLLAATVQGNLLAPGMPLPTNAKDISHLADMTTAYPAATGIPAYTTVFWNTPEEVLRFTAARMLSRGEALCCETYNAQKSLTADRQTISFETASLPAQSDRAYVRAQLSVNDLSFPHVTYSYDGLQETYTDCYYLVTDDGYVIISDLYAYYPICHFSYDAFTNTLTYYSETDYVNHTLSEGPNTFFRADSLPSGMTPDQNLYATRTVVSSSEVRTADYPIYTWAGTDGAAGDTCAVATAIGFVVFEGALLSEGKTYSYNTYKMQMTVCPTEGGTPDVIPSSNYTLQQSCPAGAVVLSTTVSSSINAAGLAAGNTCFLETSQGTLYALPADFILRPGEVLVLDEAERTVTDSRGFAYPVYEASDILAAELAMSPRLLCSAGDRKCIVISGNSRTVTRTTPSPLHPQTLHTADKCSWQITDGTSTDAFALSSLSILGQPLLLAGDSEVQDRLYKTSQGRIMLNNRFLRYTFSGTEMPLSYAEMGDGFAVAFDLFDSTAADNGTAFCSHFPSLVTDGTAAQSVFFLSSGTGKAVFWLHPSEFFVETAEQAAQILRSYMAGCASQNRPVTVVLRRASVIQTDFTSSASALVALSPMSGDCTMQFLPPSGGVTPTACSVSYFSHRKGSS